MIFLKPPSCPSKIDGADADIVDAFLDITDSLDWHQNTNVITTKAQQHVYFLRKVSSFKVNQSILLHFYRGIIESILNKGSIVRYGNITVADKALLQRIVNTASKIVGTQLTSVESLYQKRLLKRAESIVNDMHHPDSSHFELMKSGLYYRSIATRTNRFGNSFFPSAVGAMNGIF